MPRCFREIRQGFPKLTLCASLCAGWLSLSPLASLLAEGPPAARTITFSPATPPATLGAAMLELAGQSQSSIDVPEELAGRRLTLSSGRELKFWEALQGLSHAGEVNWSWGEDRKISIIPRPQADFVSGWGVSESILIRGTGQRRAATQGKELLRVNLVVDVEPSRWPLFGEVRDAEVEVRVGESALAPYSPAATRTLRFSSQQAEGALDYVGDGLASVNEARVSGKFLLRLAAGREVLRLPLTAGQATPRQVGQTAITLLGSHSIGQAMHVELSVANEQMLTWESHQQALLHRDAWLENLDGRKLKFDELEAEPEGTAGQRVRYRFPVPPGNLRDWRMVYVAAIDVRDVTVPFTLEKVPVRPQNTER